MLNKIKITENFHLNEFECRHCKSVKLHPELLSKLQVLRTTLNKPLIVNSGYRCPIHNKNVGGATQSQHLEGTAADINIHSIDMPIEGIALIAESKGFTGIGLYNNFIHLDVRASPARWDGRN